tara:strand:- start:124 stop:900 length:777 start_codon:yes stop_codon:yes gene_type:complete
MLSFFTKHKFLALLFLVGVLLFLNLGSQTLRGTLSALFSPVQSLLWEAGTSTAGIFSKVPKEHARELEAENFLLRQELLSLKEVAKENERLRGALDTASREDFNLLFAEIIGKETERDVLLLNKGSSEGAKEGMPVITQSRVAVGSIGEVFLHTSKVSLLSLRDHASDVKIQGKELMGVLKGQGRFRALLDLILQGEELLGGDVVVTSALGGTFPDNLLVGELKEVEKSDLAAFQGGAVELFFHPRKENSLFIITNYP